MAKTREIKKRIKAVANIRRITKTMQMIATSKFARAQQASVASKPYTQALFELVSQLAASLPGEASGDAAHPLLATNRKLDANAKDLTLVITSDRGLCGPYNGSILRAASQLFKTTPSTKTGLVEVIGKKGQGFFKYAGVNVSQMHTLGDKPSFEQVRAMAQEYTRLFLAGEVANVRVVSMKYISAGKQVPTVLQLLPFEPPAAKAADAAEAAGAKQLYEFDPSPRELLDSLLPAAVNAMLFQAINDAIVSEHIARMVAMKSATDNAGKAGKRYTRVYNRARQAQITTELTEIISGAAALE
jgi:F-type H+-transporting ATPase subunit gamma